MNDILSRDAILSEMDVEITLELYSEVTSTNDLARERAAQGAAEGLVILAEAQSAGRGRFGRSFFSPAGTGLYLSLLLRPEGRTEEALFITTVAAVAAAEAIEAIGGVDAKIKWVNDIYCGDKKVCGILTEASPGRNGQGLAYAILGLGINVRPPEQAVPQELIGKLGTVFQSGDAVQNERNRLAAEFLNRFFNYYRDRMKQDALRAYRERSYLNGKTVEVRGTGANELTGGIAGRRAFVLGVDEAYRLRVRWEDGTEAVLQSGEVRVVPENDLFGKARKNE